MPGLILTRVQRSRFLQRTKHFVECTAGLPRRTRNASRILGGDFHCAQGHLLECSAGLLKRIRTTSEVLGGHFRCALRHLLECSAGLLKCTDNFRGVRRPVPKCIAALTWAHVGSSLDYSVLP